MDVAFVSCILSSWNIFSRDFVRPLGMFPLVTDWLPGNLHPEVQELGWERMSGFFSTRSLSRRPASGCDEGPVSVAFSAAEVVRVSVTEPQAAPGPSAARGRHSRPDIGLPLRCLNKALRVPFQQGRAFPQRPRGPVTQQPAALLPRVPSQGMWCEPATGWLGAWFPRGESRGRLLTAAGSLEPGGFERTARQTLLP